MIVGVIVIAGIGAFNIAAMKQLQDIVVEKEMIQTQINHNYILYAVAIVVLIIISLMLHILVPKT